MELKPEFMKHPFSGELCVVNHLDLGAVIELGDLYRSVTNLDEKSGLGCWYTATETIVGTAIGPVCNVHFVRLTPVENGALAPLENE